jgi:hypothetical protein
VIIIYLVGQQGRETVALDIRCRQEYHPLSSEQGLDLHLPDRKLNPEIPQQL